MSRRQAPNPRFKAISIGKGEVGRMLPIVLTLVALASCEKPPTGPEPSITVSVDRDRISVGDRIAYRVRAVVDPGTPFVLKDYQGSIGTFPILKSDFKESVEGGRRIIEHLYTISSFSTGIQRIAPPVLSYVEEELVPSPIEIDVVSVLAESPELKDIKGPVGMESASTLYLLLGLAVALLVCALLFLYLKGRKRREEAPSPELVIPPHEMAYRELEIIRSMNLIAKGMIKEYYTRICDVLRRYVEGAFGISAPEMTTEEFLETAAVSGVLKEDHRELLRDFLNQCDLVKFARYDAPREEAEAIYCAAKRFVDETKPVGTIENEGRK